jgi:cytochrome c-type biogenesis protein
LLLVYSLGLALPFVAASLLLGRMGGLLRLLSRHAKTVNRVAGGLLLLIGVVLLSGYMPTVSAWLNRALPSIEL